MGKLLSTKLVRVVTITLVSILVLATFAIQNTSAADSVPRRLNYQGRLMDSSDNLLTGTYYLCFSVWDNATVGVGNQIWPASTPTPTTITTSNGVFSAEIGSADALGLDFDTYDYYLQVYVNPSSSCSSGGETLSPRQHLTSAAYSINADMLDGLDAATSGADAHILATDSSGNVQVSSALGVGYDPTTISGGVAAFNGNVGIGTTSPGYKLQISGTGTVLYSSGGITGVYGSGSIYGVYGASTSAYGVYGESSSGYGVYGTSTSSYGIYGASADNYGVYGLSTSSYGVRGTSTSSSGVYGASSSGYGVYGTSTSGYGVYGVSSNNIGVYGASTSSFGVCGLSTSGYGIYGRSISNRSGYFYRNSDTATVPNFEIISDHTGDTQTVLRIQGDGSGDLVNIFDDLTEVFTILDGGNVGIGTTGPNHKLDVHGEVGFYNSGIDGTLGDAVFLGSASYPTTYRNKIQSSISGTAANSKLIFSLSTGASTYADVMTLLGNGNVGIGTPSPAVKLHIAGTTNSLLVGDSGALPNGVKITAGEILQTGTGVNLSIRTSGGNIFLQEFTGNVGIGTTAPLAKLAINGGLHVGGDSDPGDNNLLVDGTGTFSGVTNANGGLSQDGNIILNGTDTWLRTTGATGWNSSTYGGGWYMVDTTWIRTYGSKNIYHNTGIMRTDGTFQVGDGGGTLNVVNGGNFAYRTNVLFANTSGNVGIGTTTLDGNAKLQAKGSIFLGNSTNDTTFLSAGPATGGIC